MTVKNALRYLVDNEVRETTLQDFKAVVERQDRLYDLIKEFRLPGEPPEVEVATKPRHSDLQGLAGASSDARGCNNGRDKENHTAGNVTGQNRPDVTARIAELASQGLSSRKIADTLASEGIEISHMTIARRLQGDRLATKDTRLLHNGGLNDRWSE